MNRTMARRTPLLSKRSDLAWRRTGGWCACGCSRPADEEHLIFPPDRWPELADHIDNKVALSSWHKKEGRKRSLPSRATRHAALLATTAEMRAYLKAEFGGQVSHGHASTYKDLSTGRIVRRCATCRQWKDLKREFATARSAKTGAPSDYAYECKRCKVRRTGPWLREQLKRPEVKAQYAAWAKQWRESHPERSKATMRRFYEKLQRDPSRRVRYAENARMYYRLRREREGRPVRTAHKDVVSAKDRLPELPVAPFLELVDSYADATEQPISTVADEFGFSSRSHRRWTREGGAVRFDTADAVLTALGLNWFEVWPEDRYPEVHERMGRS